MNWCIYLVRCADNSLYCGITNDLKARVLKHNAGLASKYTRSRLPVEMVYYKESANRSTASKEEYRIKQLSKSQKESMVEAFKLGYVK